MAMLAKRLSAHEEFEHILCVTGQHRHLLDQVLEFFEIAPDYDLDIMKENQQLADITSSVLSEVTNLCKIIKPDLMLVQGDTNTCFASALAAFYLQIKIGHVEAGLRTGDINAPFPEEANRKLTSTIVNYHFAPTRNNALNLMREGIHRDNIIETGNTVIDSLIYASNKVIEFTFHMQQTKLAEIIRANKRIILVTGHRRESFGDGFRQICNALKEIAHKYPHIFIVYPVHMNSNVSGTVFKILENVKNIILTEPLEYPDFVFLMKKSWIILTDSGGVQEEAPTLGKPVLVMRDVSERTEAIEAGTVKLIGTEHKNIVKNVQTLLEDENEYQAMVKAHNLYGDGLAVERIIHWLEKNASHISNNGTSL
jgi:UDP-N-acetylglucosamine 2-epimerase (non-hydrolysing)